MRLCILHSGRRCRHRARVRFTAIRTMNARYLTRRWRHWAWAHHRFGWITAADCHHILMHWRGRLTYECGCRVRWTGRPINGMIVRTGVQNGRTIAQRNHTVRYVWLVFRCNKSGGCDDLIRLAQLACRFGCIRFNVKCRRYQIAVASILLGVRLIDRCRDVIHIRVIDVREFLHFR